MSLLCAHNRCVILNSPQGLNNCLWLISSCYLQEGQIAHHIAKQIGWLLKFLEGSPCSDMCLSNSTLFLLIA